MRTYLLYLECAVSLMTVLILSGCATVASDWAKTQKEGTAQAYETFLHDHPSSDQAVQARATLDGFAWKEAEQIGTADAYEMYLNEFPKGSHSNDARNRLDDFTWSATKHEETLQAYASYIEKHLRGDHEAEARSQVDRMTYEAALKKDSVTTLRDYIRASETGSLPGGFVKQAQSRLEQLLRNAVLSDTDMADLIGRMGKLAAPFSLRELYEECTQTPPKKDPNTLFSFSGSSPGRSSGEVSTISDLGEAVVSTKARRQPDKTPAITTIVYAVLGNRVEVNHIEGTVSFTDLYNGFKERSSKPRLVFTLRNPSKYRPGGIGFEELEVYSTDGGSQRYIQIGNQWYTAD
jgi:uncharacterized protein YceK